MEAQYHIAVRNRYDFFIDDDIDPYEILKQQEQAAEKSKEKPAKDASKKAAKRATNSAKKAPQQSQNVPETKVDQNQNKKDGKSRSSSNSVRAVEGPVRTCLSWSRSCRCAHLQT